MQRSALGESRPSLKGGPDLKAVHRLYAPMELDGRLNSVQLTVKEYGTGARRHYAVDHVELQQRPDAFSPDPQGSLLEMGQSPGRRTVNLSELHQPFKDRTATVKNPFHSGGLVDQAEADSAGRFATDQARTNTVAAAK
jgi:hypothetical protein